MFKQKFQKFRIAFLIVAILIMALPQVVGAAPLLQEDSPPVASEVGGFDSQISFPELLDAVDYVKEVLPGLTVLLVVLGIAVNLLKPYYKDGQASKVYNMLMAGAIVFLTLFKLFLPNIDLLAINGFAQKLIDNFIVLAPTAMVILKMVAPKFYDAIKGIKWLGQSHSDLGKASA